jgi:hypothetical protein
VTKVIERCRASPRARACYRAALEQLAELDASA